MSEPNAEEQVRRWNALRATAWRLYTNARKQGENEQRAVERVVEALHAGELCVHVEMDLAVERTKKLARLEREGMRPVDRNLLIG